MLPCNWYCNFVFVGETFLDKSSENQADIVCNDNVFVYGERMISVPVAGRKIK